MTVNDSIKQTLTVAVLLCLVCSIVVSTATVLLKPIQLVNKNLDKQARILALVDLLDKKQDIKTQFNRYVETRIVDLDSGRFVDNFNIATFDQKKFARDPSTSVVLGEKDIAGINRRARYTTVYLIKKADRLEYLVLPVHGYGLWSTMYGFIALQNDLNTVYGISFYEHAETPGLGGEIDNAAWQGLWRGKKIFASTDFKDVRLNVVKGNVNPAAEDADFKIDGLAGATLTARGVGNMIRFWFGEMGYQTFITNFADKG